MFVLIFISVFLMGGLFLVYFYFLFCQREGGRGGGGERKRERELKQVCKYVTKKVMTMLCWFLISYKKKSELQWSLHIGENGQCSKAKQLTECNYRQSAELHPFGSMLWECAQSPNTAWRGGSAHLWLKDLRKRIRSSRSPLVNVKSSRLAWAMRDSASKINKQTQTY